VHPEDREQTQAAWGDAQRTGEYYAEHRVRRSIDGDYRWHQTRACPVEGADDGEWVGTMTDIHDLRSLKDRQQVLMGELQHRTRNLLAVVQAIAVQTQRTSDSLEKFGTEFESRLRALSRVQSLLARVDHQDVDLRDLVMAELEAHRDEGMQAKMRVEGPSVPLPATSAQAVGLALHELATNAVKYGAVAQADGRLEVFWREEADGGKRCVALDWVESGVTMPDRGRPYRKGYGTHLIQRALTYQLGAQTKLDFGADGVRCKIIVPLKGERREAGRG
jgi:two-component sensor histidine kinase